LRSKLFTSVGACLAVAAALTLPSLSQAGPAAAASAGGTLPVTAAAAAPTAASEPTGAKDCAAPTNPLMMQCQSIIATSAKAEAAATAAAKAAMSARAKGAAPAVSALEPLEPVDLQAAYGIASAASSNGYGKTIAIVDAFYDPNAQSDLAQYRTDFGLLTCGRNVDYPRAACLNVYNQNGTNLGTDPKAAPPRSPSDDDWVPETSLDLEMVAAICPNCTIDLIEATNDELPNLGKAEDTAVSLGAKYISDSWVGSGDFPGESAYDSYFNHPGVVITVAAGDYGYAAGYPAASQFVTSVGGTYLNQNGSGDWTSTVWQDNGSQNADGVAGATASGCSSGEPQPSWEADATDSTASNWCANRTENDVSAVADAPSGIDIYDSAECNPFCDAYGTSAATPIIAAMYALAGAPAASTYPASYPYANAGDLTKVTSGSDGSCEPARQYLCTAAHSLSSAYGDYNGPAGLGTPNGDLAPFEAPATDTVSVANPGTTDIQQGASVSLPIKAIDSAGQKLTYSASLPDGLTINSATGVISGKAVFVENDTVRVTATDGTASASVYFRLPSSASLTADYHAGAGQVRLGWDGKCLNDAGNSSANGSKAEIWACTSNAAAQVWSFKPSTAPGEVADAGLSQLGSIEIHGKCLSTSANSAASGAKLQLWACNGATSELWEITGAYGGLYNPASGRCVDDTDESKTNGSQLDIYSCNGEPWQDWLLPGSPFESAVAGKCIADGSSANGSGVNSYACTGQNDEKLQVAPAGSYALLELNGKCLNAAGNGTNDGTPIQLYTCADSSGYAYNANLWYLTAYGQLENAQAQKCLAIPNNSAANSTRLELEDCYGEPGEVWSAS
jgi:Ricin-type beta-trefoil lectin domain/Putative Ig domain